MLDIRSLHRFTGFSRKPSAQCSALHTRWPSRTYGIERDRADDGRDPDKGVNFKNPHSLHTTPNASAMATGHYLGDTGDFSNTIYSGFPVPGAGNSLTPFLESDPVLGDVDEHFAGDYVDEVTLLKAARDAGISTATIGASRRM